MAVIRKECNTLLRLAKKGKQRSNECNYRLSTFEQSVIVNRLSKCPGLYGALVNDNLEYSSSF